MINKSIKLVKQEAVLFIAAAATAATCLFRLPDLQSIDWKVMAASLANLISYKLYCKEYSRERYNKLFYPLNFILLVLLLSVGIVITKFTL